MKRNKILALLTVASMAVSMTAPVGVVSAAEVSTEEVTIEVVEDELPEGAVKEGAFTAVGDTIIAFDEELGDLDIVIPEEIGGVTITKLGEEVFALIVCNSITMPDTITEIGEYAFAYTAGKNVKFSKNLKKIGSYAFVNNFEGIQLDTLPEGLEEIGEKAFASCVIENEDTVVIPDSVTTLGKSVFWGSKLKSVKIGNGITEIPEYTFFSCSLSEIVIPEGITSIGASAFWGNNLTEVSISSSVTTIENHAFCINNITEVFIPSSVTTIERYAFYSNNITEVFIPSSVTTLEEWAFDETCVITRSEEIEPEVEGPYELEFEEEQDSNALEGDNDGELVPEVENVPDYNEEEQDSNTLEGDNDGEYDPEYQPDYNEEEQDSNDSDGNYDGEDDGEIQDEVTSNGVITDTISFIDGIGAKIVSTVLDTVSDVYTLLADMAAEMGYTSVFSAYEFSLVEGNISEGITVSFDLGTENNGRKAIVLHQKQDGEVETFESVVINGIVTATVNELSPFMVVLEDGSTSGTSNEDVTIDSTSPKTGDTTNIMVWMLAMMATLALGVVTLNKKENN